MISYHIILYYIILYCIVLYYIVLYYIILYYILGNKCSLWTEQGSWMVLISSFLEDFKHHNNWWFVLVRHSLLAIPKRSWWRRDQQYSHRMVTFFLGEVPKFSQFNMVSTPFLGGWIHHWTGLKPCSQWGLAWRSRCQQGSIAQKMRLMVEGRNETTDSLGYWEENQMQCDHEQGIGRWTCSKDVWASWTKVLHDIPHLILPEVYALGASDCSGSVCKFMA
jgi:hypothetical protein